MPLFIEKTLLSLVDWIFKYLPQKTPSADQLSSCRLVSHRGERDDKNIFENTFAAFDPILENNIWGIEFDIRWTQDLVPIVVHDVDAKRVFGKDFVIAENTWEACQQALPQVPSLEQLIDRYGKRCHLMIELKKEHYPQPEKQQAILQELLSGLKPVEDFHIIALHIELFEHVTFLPNKALVPVSTTNAKDLSQQAIDNDLGGITGHFVFMNQQLINKHHKAQQKIGSGFANSKHSLFCEINKSIDWVFSNKALTMHQIIEEHLLESKC